MDSTGSSFRRPSRRALLRGATLLTVAGGATLTARSSFASGRPTVPTPADEVDYPGATWVPADPANYTVASRPSSYSVDYVVIHVTQETYDDTLAIFQNPERQVSAHYVVSSAEGLIGQCVREKDVAWHAGNWDYNTRSVGIEHEGWVDQPEWFTDAMYAASAALTRTVCETYGIPMTREHIIGHNEVPGATHTDPGEHWDWARYIAMVNGD